MEADTISAGVSRPKIASVASPAPAASWHRLFESDIDVVPDASPEYTAAICAGTRWTDASRLYRFCDGRDFVLPLLRHRWSPTAASMPPAHGMGGLVGPDLDGHVVAAVADDVRRAHLSTRVRPSPLAGQPWAEGLLPLSGDPMRAHVVDLTGGADGAWSRLRRSGRQGINRARRADLEIEVDTTGALIPEFRDLMQRSVERWARQQHEPRALAKLRAATRDPKGALETIAGRLGSRMRTIIARADGIAVAGNIVLHDRNAHGIRAAMDKEKAAHSRINYLLVWLQIEMAAHDGCRWFHMGESGTSSQLAEFKERFGARPHEYAAYYIERVPLSRADRAARTAVKRLIGFRD